MKSRFLPLLLLSLFWMGCGSEKEQQSNEQSVRPVKYVTVGANDIVGSHSFTGLAKAQQEASLSFKISGTIDDIFVKVGDRVRKGQELARIDATDYQVNYNQSLASVESSKAQVDNAIAQLESVKANYLNAQSNYNRFEKLYETNSISLSDFEQAKSSFLSAEASYKAAKTQIAAAEAASQSSKSLAQSASNQVNYTRMRAPFSGVVTNISAEPNELVGQGTPIMEINSLSNPDVEIGVPENAISQITPKQNVKITFSSLDDHVMEGVVHEIGYSSSGSTYPVTIRLTENDDRIRPGMPASAAFVSDAHKSKNSQLLVPPSAVGEDGDGKFVYLIEKNVDDYVCKKKAVQIGALSDAGFEIKSGLSAGDKVASSGLNIIREGMLVSLYDKK